MGCLLLWCILERAIIFPLRLHFTRQINQALIQQPLLVSGWEPLVPGTEKTDQTKCQLSPGLPHVIAAHGPAETLSCARRDEVTGNYQFLSPDIFFFLLQSYGFLFSVLHWGYFSPDVALAEKSFTAQQWPCLPMTFPILITHKLFLNLGGKNKWKWMILQKSKMKTALKLRRRLWLPALPCNCPTGKV